MPPKLSDNEVYDLIHKAAETLGRAEGATIRGNTALQVARRSLTALQLALVMADTLGCVISPSEPAPRSD
jgi:hypothetical protein